MPDAGTRAGAAGLVAESLRILETAAALRVAVAGDGATLVQVSDRDHFFYARLGDTDGEVVEVRYDVVHPNDGDVVLIERVRPLGLGEWWLSFWLRDATDPNLAAPIVGSGRVRPESQLLVDDDLVQLLDDDSVELTE